MKKWENELKFFKGRCPMASKNMKKCSTFLAIKEMKMKITLRFHLIAFRMAIVRDSKMVARGRKQKASLL
jgi:hypothetical protein